MCRHSGYFYDAFKTRGVLAALVDRCADPDRTTRKFACFAIGNAGFHGDALYGQLRAAIRAAHEASRRERGGQDARQRGGGARKSREKLSRAVRRSRARGGARGARGTRHGGRDGRVRGWGWNGGRRGRAESRENRALLARICARTRSVGRDSSRSGSKRAWTRWRIRGIRPCAGTSRAYRVRSPPRGTAAGGERRRRRSGESSPRGRRRRRVY